MQCSIKSPSSRLKAQADEVREATFQKVQSLKALLPID